MSHDNRSLLSSVGVGLAVIGSAIPDVLLQVAGPLLALAVHVWTERSRTRADSEKDREIADLKRENSVLRSLVAMTPCPDPPAERTVWTPDTRPSG